MPNSKTAEKSGRVVQPGFQARVAEAVKRIPPGQVATYGDMAALLGSPRVARHVGWALAALSDPALPWHRVINAKGEISGGSDSGRPALQRALLESEGVTFDAAGRVRLSKHRWLQP